MKTHQSNTYDLILQSESEDKGRTIIETLIYAVLILGAVVSIISAAAQPIVVPNRLAAKDCKVEYCA